MKTLADLRRALTVDTAVHIENHRVPALSGDRTVIVAQTKSWCFTFPDGHPKQGGKHKGSWLTIPKAADCTFDGDTVAIVDDLGHLFLTITVPAPKGPA